MGGHTNILCLWTHRDNGNMLRAYTALNCVVSKCSTAQPRSYLQLTTTCKGKINFLQWSLCYKKADPRPSRERPTRNELSANFGGVLSCTALSRHCFTFLISWLCVIVSRLYFYEFCVCTCMSLCDSHMFFLCFFSPLFISLLCSILTCFCLFSFNWIVCFLKRRTVELWCGKSCICVAFIG